MEQGVVATAADQHVIATGSGKPKGAALLVGAVDRDGADRSAENRQSLPGGEIAVAQYQGATVIAFQLDDLYVAERLGPEHDPLVTAVDQQRVGAGTPVDAVAPGQRAADSESIVAGACGHGVAAALADVEDVGARRAAQTIVPSRALYVEEGRLWPDGLRPAKAVPHGHGRSPALFLVAM